MFPVYVRGNTVVIRDMGMDNLENLADMLNGMPDAVYATGIEPPVTSEALYRKYENVFRNRDEIFAGIYPIGSQELSGLIRAVIRRIHGDFAKIVLGIRILHNNGS